MKREFAIRHILCVINNQELFAGNKIFNSECQRRKIIIIEKETKPNGLKLHKQFDHISMFCSICLPHREPYTLCMWTLNIYVKHGIDCCVWRILITFEVQKRTRLRPAHYDIWFMTLTIFRIICDIDDSRQQFHKISHFFIPWNWK